MNQSRALGRVPSIRNFKIEWRNESLKLPSKEFLKQHNPAHIKLTAGSDERDRERMLFPEIRILLPSWGLGGRERGHSRLRTCRGPQGVIIKPRPQMALLPLTFWHLNRGQPPWNGHWSGLMWNGAFLQPLDDYLLGTHDPQGRPEMLGREEGTSHVPPSHRFRTSPLLRSWS